jgi:hypothetical protein
MAYVEDFRRVIVDWIPGPSNHPHLGPPPSAVFASSYAVPSRGRKNREVALYYAGMTGIYYIAFGWTAPIGRQECVRCKARILRKPETYMPTYVEAFRRVITQQMMCY